MCYGVNGVHQDQRILKLLPTGCVLWNERNIVMHHVFCNAPKDVIPCVIRPSIVCLDVYVHAWVTNSIIHVYRWQCFPEKALGDGYS